MRRIGQSISSANHVTREKLYKRVYYPNMILSSHVAIGVAVGTAAGSPLAGFVIGFVSHHIADMIPHTDPGSDGASVENMLQNKKVLRQLILDFIFSVLIIMFTVFVNGYSIILLASVAGAILPDVIDNSPFWSPYLRKVFPTDYYHRFHEYFHFTIMNKKYYYFGYLTQCILIAISLYIVVK